MSIINDNSMKAVIKLAGQQFLVEEGSKITVRKTLPVGEKQLAEKVLFLFDETNVEVGKPELKVKVQYTVLENKKTKKVRVFKYKAKKGYRVTTGHRQPVSIIEINKISK